MNAPDLHAQAHITNPYCKLVACLLGGTDQHPSDSNHSINALCQPANHNLLNYGACHPSHDCHVGNGAVLMGGNVAWNRQCKQLGFSRGALASELIAIHHGILHNVCMCAFTSQSEWRCDVCTFSTDGLAHGGVQSTHNMLISFSLPSKPPHHRRVQYALSKLVVSGYLVS